MSPVVHECPVRTAPPEADWDTDSVLSRFARQARLHAGDAAVIGQETTLTYAELDRLSNRIAHSVLNLRPAAAQEQLRVGLLVDAGPPAIAAMLGALKAGALYVPLDPSYPETRTECMVR